jgi:hypothetical protein
MMIEDMMIPMLSMRFVVAIDRTSIYDREPCEIRTKRRRKSTHSKSKPPWQKNPTKQLD